MMAEILSTPSLSFNSSNAEASSVLGDGFRAILSERTPPGYSGRLKDSVLMESAGESVLVGYDEAVETSGDPELEKIPRSKRTVLRWVSTENLRSVLLDAFDSYEDQSSVIMSDWLMSQGGGSVLS